MDYSAWLKEIIEPIVKWWIDHRSELGDYRESYRWPPNLSTEESLHRRADVAQAVRTEVESRGTITSRTAERVLEWGGLHLPPNTDALKFENALAQGFAALKADDTEAAARTICELPQFGVSRASKLLALSDEDKFGIYDSRSSWGLCDLIDGRHPLVGIAPGRIGKPTRLGNPARNFARYTSILRALASYARDDRSLNGVLGRPADVEMALFMRGDIVRRR